MSAAPVVAAHADRRGAATWRGLRAAASLGWAVSSNWTKPLLFVIYSVLRPVSGALILAVMYRVVAGDSEHVRGYLAFLVVGAAFWAFVQNGLVVLAMGVSDDRGRYRQLKYIYMSPLPFPLYLLGRGAAQLGSAVASVLIVLLVATPALGLPIDVRHVDWPLLLMACLLAFAAVTVMGMALSVLLLGARDGYGYGEMLAQVAYVVSGAIFPISVLPGPVAAFAAWLPLCYWLELVRRALLDSPAASMFPDLGTGAVLLRLLGTSLLIGAVSVLLLRFGDRLARRRGLLDKETQW